jgi:MoaA/NifB/PqqE/SkfB family radical SAM enzyme
LLREQQFDVIFSTNGTLLRSHLDQLAGIRNLIFLLSIDGDEQAHDKVRGKGTFKSARDSIRALFELRRSRGVPLPAVIMSTVVCEWTTDILKRVYEVARDFHAIAINYNFRWFLTEDVGKAYERHLQHEFGVKSSGAWFTSRCARCPRSFPDILSRCLCRMRRDIESRVGGAGSDLLSGETTRRSSAS